jgi:hypothetical protein
LQFADSQLADRVWRIEAPWSSATRIEVKHALPKLLAGAMRVAANHSREVSGSGSESERARKEPSHFAWLFSSYGVAPEVE